MFARGEPVREAFLNAKINELGLATNQDDDAYRKRILNYIDKTITRFL